MDIREKLIEILENSFEKQYEKRCFLTAPHTAEDLISNGVTVQEWISVDDRLPEEKADCIVYYQHAYCDNDGYWAIGICFNDGEKFQLGPAYKVTHWMPMPEPPKGE